MLNRLRRRIDRAVSLRVDPRFASLAADVDARFAHQATQLTDYEARLRGLQSDYDFVRSEFDRLAPQVAALEYRFERLSARVGDVGQPEVDLARAELEHERARLRLELAAHYEERLRRLEDQD